MDWQAFEDEVNKAVKIGRQEPQRERPYDFLYQSREQLVRKLFYYE
jgi:hypothetical protein